MIGTQINITTFKCLEMHSGYLLVLTFWLVRYLFIMTKTAAVQIDLTKGAILRIRFKYDDHLRLRCRVQCISPVIK